MALLKKPPQKDENDKRITGILDFATRVIALLRDRASVPAELQVDVRSNIKRMSVLSPGPAVAAKASTFDSAGTELWNGTTNILRDIEEPLKDPRLRRDVPNEVTVLLRVFAFHLLDAAYRASPRRTKDLEQRTRNFKVALKTSRSCLHGDELDLALKVLEKCSDHVSAVKSASPLVRLTEEDSGGDNEEDLKVLTAEFHLLRIMHAWKSGRLDLAAHFTTKLNFESVGRVTLGEKAADLFYEIGKFLLKQMDTSSASDWLERALKALDTCDIEQLSDDAADLRLSITAKLVKCLSFSTDPSAWNQTRRIVEQLAANPSVGNRLAVQVMQLDLLHAEVPIKLDRVQATLSRIIRSSIVTEKTFKIVMQAVHRTKRHSVQVACDTLSALIRTRLLPLLSAAEETNEADAKRLETACVTFVLVSVEGAKAAGSNALDALKDKMDLISHEISGALSARALHAMQTLIWKTLQSADASQLDSWLHLLRHSAFDGAGQTNKAVIGRKAILLALQRNDLDGAREAYYRLSQAMQCENLTQYLVFKLALRCDDYALACGSLESIIKHTQENGKFLYACVLEAQESKMRRVAVVAFEALLDKQPPGVHLPTLLRCTARLLAAELESSTAEQMNDVVNEIVQVFEKAAANVKTLKQGTGDHWRADVQWWSKNAYNLSLKLCGEAHPERLYRLLSACTTFIDHYPKDGGIMHEDDLKRRKMLCHFLSATALIVLARSAEEADEYSLQCYLDCRQQVQEVNALCGNAEMNDDISRKRFELLKYDIECIFKLQQWDQLNAALQACLDCKNVDRWDTLADLVLIIHSQSSIMGFEGHENVQMITLIQRIINETWKKDRDLVKVSRWLRLSFSIDIGDGDGAFALKLLQQAADMAKKVYEGPSDQKYPETELQWLSTTAFNRAVDFLSAGEYEASKDWIEGALEVARYAADEGALHANLSYKKKIAMERIERGVRV